MSAPRLASHMLVGRMIRQAQGVGGFATVLRKGDVTSGSILVQLVERGQEKGLYESRFDAVGRVSMAPAGQAHWADPEALSQYMARRTRSDPDIWIMELDIPEGEQFIASLCD